MTAIDEREVYRFFLGSVILKGLISLAEVVVGIAVLLIPQQVIVHTVDLIVRNFLPGSLSFLGPRLIESAAEFTAATALFVSVYLLVRGLIKVFLIWGLLANKMWAYPASLLVLGLLVLYQIYQILSKGSILIILLTVFD